MRIRLSRGVMLGVSVLAFSASLFGQSAVSASAKAPVSKTVFSKTPLYGLSGVATALVPAFEFSTFNQADPWSPVNGSPDRYLTGGGHFEATVHIPQGALITAIEAEGCDNSATGSLNGLFAIAAAPGGGGGVIQTFDSGGPDTPGCGFFSAAVGPMTVDNHNNQYFFELNNSPGDGTVYYAAMRVYYMLQVSPAPGSPTFSDIGPGDPAWPFVEAFVAAGITVGCDVGPPARYCPDDPVTRRQVAVFLSKALGLYWPY